MPRTVPVTIRLSPAVAERLRREAAQAHAEGRTQREVSQSSIVENALSEHFSRADGPPEHENRS